MCSTYVRNNDTMDGALTQRNKEEYTHNTHNTQHTHNTQYTYLLLLAGKSLWSTAAAGRPPGPSMPLSAFPKSSRTKAEGEVPRPKILGDDPAAGGVLEQSCAANTTSAMRCL